MSTETKSDFESDDKHDRNERGGDSGHGNDRNVIVTIAAPNNVSREFEVDLHDRVDKVAREAVRTFVRAHEMEQMECSLVLIVDGTARPLDDAARLEEVGVHNHSRLALVPKQPKTDG